jgi:hypothetical protein
MQQSAIAIAEPKGRPRNGTDPNTKGWESIARKWANVQWPRRPKWNGEFDKARPLLDSARCKEALVFGATPEFRLWLNSSRAKVTLYEKSDKSLKAMTAILRRQSCCPKTSERVLADDWESQDFERGRYRLVMGDIILGYLETKDRLLAFLSKVRQMLASDGAFLLRDFAYVPYREGNYASLPVDSRRWAYVLTPGIAVEGKKFYEEMLAFNLRKARDFEAAATCANPPRTRLMLDFMELTRAFRESHLQHQMLVPQSPGSPQPGLWVLTKKGTA